MVFFFLAWLSERRRVWLKLTLPYKFSSCPPKSETNVLFPLFPYWGGATYCNCSVFLCRLKATLKRLNDIKDLPTRVIFANDIKDLQLYFYNYIKIGAKILNDFMYLQKILKMRINRIRSDWTKRVFWYLCQRRGRTAHTGQPRAFWGIQDKSPMISWV